jgi:hypothetical protein
MRKMTLLVFALGGLHGLMLGQVLPTAVAAPKATEIRTEAGMIVFVVDGQEMARIDQAGLSVNGRIRSVSLADTAIDAAPTDSHSAPERPR